MGWEVKCQQILMVFSMSFPLRNTLEQIVCSTTIQLVGMISCGLTELSSGATRTRQITDTDNEGQIDNHATEGMHTVSFFHGM